MLSSRSCFSVDVYRIVNEIAELVSLFVIRMIAVAMMVFVDEKPEYELKS